MKKLIGIIAIMILFSCNRKIISVAEDYNIYLERDWNSYELFMVQSSKKILEVEKVEDNIYRLLVSKRYTENNVVSDIDNMIKVTRDMQSYNNKK
jgi:hypothetical protein